MTKTYKIKIKKDGGTGFYTASCKNPDLTTQGINFVDAFTMIGEAIYLLECENEKLQ